MKRFLLILFAIIFVSLSLFSCNSQNDGGDFIYETMETSYLSFEFPKNWQLKSGSTTSVTTYDGKRGIKFYSSEYTEAFESITSEEMEAALKSQYEGTPAEMSGYTFKKDTSKGFDMLVAEFDVIGIECPFHQIVYRCHIGDKIATITIFYENETDTSFATHLYDTLTQKN